MSSSVIERDAIEQGKFADYMVMFQCEMSRCCSDLKNYVEDARDSVQADNAQEALNTILSLVESIEKGISGVGDFAGTQKVLSKKIQKAEEIRFTGR